MRYERINRRSAECECMYCACPLYLGDSVYTDEEGTTCHCSKRCYEEHAEYSEQRWIHNPAN